MSEVRLVKRTYQDLFLPQNGKTAYTKKYCNEHRGPYEVYSGTTVGSFAFIDVADYHGKYLSFTTDGENAGTVQLLEGDFSVGGHRTLLIPKSEKISIDYIQFELKKALEKNYKRGDVPSVHWNNIKNEEILMPVSANDDYDFEYQNELASKYIQIEEQKKALFAKLASINSTAVLIPKSKDIFWEDKPLKELFKSIERGKSKYTKTYCKNNSGDYPVYSANNSVPLAYMNSFDYDGRCLTISINGIAGVPIIIEGKFSTTADRVVCIPYEKISIDYIKYVAEPFLRDKIKGRVGDNGKNEFTKLTPDMIGEVTIPIPLDADGNYNLNVQIDYAEKYSLINEIKKDINSQVSNLLMLEVK